MSGSIKLKIQVKYCIIYFDDNLSVSYSYKNGEQNVINTIKRKEAAFTEKIITAYQITESHFQTLRTKGINLLKISDTENEYKVIHQTLNDLKMPSIRSIKLELHINGAFDKITLQDTIQPLMLKLSEL